MLLAECGPLRAAIDEEIRHGNEQLGRLGGDGASLGELAGALVGFSGLCGGEVATLINATAQRDVLDGPREPRGIGRAGFEQLDKLRALRAAQMRERPPYCEGARALRDVAAVGR